MGLLPEYVAEIAAIGVSHVTMFSTPGTPFAHLTEPTPTQVAAVRHLAEQVLPQMMPCSHCRADAVGLLGADRSAKFQSCLNECAKITDMKLERPYVAVASFSGIQVDQHLGDATHFQIWKLGLDGFQFVENRVASERGTGAQR